MDSLQKLHKKLNHRLTKCALFRKSMIADIQSNKEASSLTPKKSDITVFVGRPPPNVRLVLFQESGDTVERKNVFDSKCFQKVSTSSKSENTDENERGCPKPIVQYEIVRTPSDWDVLAEMLFGSVGMVQKAPSLKIHTIRDPPQLMVSRVFCLPSLKCPNAANSLDRRLDMHLEMPKSNPVYSRRKAQTMPVSTTPTAAIPMQKEAAAHSGSMHRSDSSNSLAAFFSSYQGLSQSFTGSLGSGLRPLSMPNKKAHSLPPNQRDSFTLYDKVDDAAPPMRQNRMRIGFAVICEPEPNNFKMFQHFFFERFPIFESHLTELKENIEKSLKIRPKQEFFEAMMKSLEIFTARLHNIYTTQRLPEPVWWTLASPNVTTSHHDLIVRHFLSDLTRTVEQYNSKQRNYFFSGLLTAVLTYHLGWVGFSTPSDGNKLNEPTEQYNNLWAQLGDLYGAVGSPTKVCRTVVSGSQHEAVSTILSVISYFIQCSNLKDKVQVPDQLTPLALKHTGDPTKNLSIDFVPCDLEESEYVLVSIKSGEKSPAKSANVTRNVVARSRSTPFQNQSDFLTLNRSNSGPMMKNKAEKGSLLVNTTSSNRHRTYSNDAVPRRPIQSRRTSSEFAAKKPAIAVAAKPPAKPRSKHLSGPAKQSILPAKIEGSFCMRQSSSAIDFKDIEWPEVPTHNPDGSGSIKHVKSTPVIKQLGPQVDGGGGGGVRREQTFLDLVEPPIENVMNVRSACVDPPRRAIAPHTFCSPEKSPRASPALGHKKTLSEGEQVTVTSCPDAEVSRKSTKSALRSVSNPSASAKKEVCGNGRINSTSSGVRCKLGTRRHALPTSPSHETAEASPASVATSESPSLERLKLMRIPSVEMNHNVFDEYFDDVASQADAAPQQSCDRRLSQETSPVALPRRGSSAPMKGPPPLLPAKGPVGVVSFKASSEEVMFHGQVRRPRVSVDAPLPSSPTSPKEKSKSGISAGSVCRDLSAKTIPVSEMKSNQKSASAGAFSPEWDSLMADYNAEYLNDFVLHGVPNQPDLHEKILKDLRQTVRNPPLDERVSEAVCIHADLDNCTVKVYSSQRLRSDKACLPALTSKLVSNIVQQVANMSSMRVSPQFCMAHLEAELRQLVLKSRMLAEYVRGHKRVTVAQLSAVLGIESQDLPLLMAVASCHSPHVAPAML